MIGDERYHELAQRQDCPQLSPPPFAGDEIVSQDEDHDAAPLQGEDVVLPSRASPHDSVRLRLEAPEHSLRCLEGAVCPQNKDVWGVDVEEVALWRAPLLMAHSTVHACTAPIQTLSIV
eukprot:CAMPEP_0113706572 /NCGR_PEP_ID=MMETSP0038_2-20120614/27807_1 /TAXON_ID=2898 /ORGANISM="Cryptomonas paramecium" /LENGTH=118 /DNA_ID=CAMNT_0000631795 /DNA_START=180 /DNA_END=537 /DNA_ORIENTATION=- /assembly_acc=CAM_ASM_000170